MARDVETVGIAAEAAGVSVHPSDGSTHLVGHGHQAAAHVLDRGEVRHDEMRAGADEQLGREGVVLREAGPPRAAVDEDVDRRAGAPGGVEVEVFDGRRAVREAPRPAETRANGVALGRVASDELLPIRRPDGLIVGRVELGLIEIEPHARPLGARTGRHGAGLLRERGAPHRHHDTGRRGTRSNAAREAITRVSRAPGGAGPRGAPLRTPRRPVRPSDPRSDGRRSGARPATRRA